MKVREKKRFSEEQIVRILGEAAGHGIAATARKYNVSDQTLDAWRRRSEGMDVRQIVELKNLHQENARLKKLVAVPCPCFIDAASATHSAFQLRFPLPRLRDHLPLV